METEICDDSMCYEHYGIGVKNESNLHMKIKKWYSIPGDRFEVKVNGNVIDIVRDKTLIEIQTKNFNAMKNKLYKLIDLYEVIVVHPIPIEKWILTTNSDGEIIRRRKSTKKGKLTDIFNELVSIPELINHENFNLDVLFTCEEELRCDNGKGSWRRKGISIINRNLVSVEQTQSFRSRDDFLCFVPFGNEAEFTNKELAAALKIKAAEARRITYCMKRMGLIHQCGKKSRELLYRRSEQKEVAQDNGFRTIPK